MSVERVTGLVDDNAGVLAAALAYVVAGVHLTHPKLGMPRLVLLVSTDSAWLLASHPRPVAFVASGFAIIVGVTLAIYGYRRRLLYVLGIVLMLTYIVGYFAWHFSGHGGFLPGRQPLYHGMAPLEAVVTHLSTSPRALVSKLAELGLLGLLVHLYRRDV